jgi:hypothetical protein
MVSTCIHLEEDLADAFQAVGLDRFDVWQFGMPPGGELLTRDSRTEVWRLQMNGELFYLKRQLRESPWKSLPMLFFGHRPCGVALRELRMIRTLRAKGFATMTPVAWGEKRCFGLPVGGFLVVREILGTEVSQLVTEWSGRRRLHLFHAIGHLVGRLHAARFFQPVRLKDLIVYEVAGSAELELTLIDRATPKPWQSPIFTLSFAFRSLARAWRRTARDGVRPGPASIAHFFQGYAEGLAPRRSLPARRLLEGYARFTRRHPNA